MWSRSVIRQKNIVITVERLDGGLAVSVKKPIDVSVTHTPEEYDFSDRLYAE